MATERVRLEGYLTNSDFTAALMNGLGRIGHSFASSLPTRNGSRQRSIVHDCRLATAISSIANPGRCLVGAEVYRRV